jgi:copper transport protein
VAVARRLAPLVVLVLSILGALLGVPEPAFAHADLQQEEPAAGAAVPAPPSALRLRFSEPLDGSATRVEVFDESGNRVDRDDLEIGPPNDRLLTVSLDGLAEGVYTVRWWSLSQSDGHRWQGTYRFGVGRTPPPADGAPAALPSPFEVAIEWGALLGTAFVVGSLAFRVWALEPALAVAGAAPKSLARFRRALNLALGLLAVASLGETVASFGLFSGVPPDVGAGLAGLGKVGALAVLRLFLVPMIAYLAAPGGSLGMALAFSALLVLTRGQVSHAAASGLGAVIVDTVHQLAGGAWVGGACTFAVVVPSLLRERPGAVRAVATRFGQLALAAAGLAIASGVLSGWLLGVDPFHLLDSRYGEALAVKIGLVALLVVAAFVVWRRRVGTLGAESAPRDGAQSGPRTLALSVLAPRQNGAIPLVPTPVTPALTPPAPPYHGASRLRRLSTALSRKRERGEMAVPPSPTGGRGAGGTQSGFEKALEGRSLRLPLAVELTLGAAVLLAASALALFPPPGETSPLPLDLVEPAGADGQLRVHLLLDKARVGDVQAEVQVINASGRPLGQADVHLSASELAPLSASLDPAPAPTDAYAEEQPDGRQIVSLAPFARPGWWRVLVTTSVQLQGTITLPFDVLVPDPNRAGLDPPSPNPAAAQLFADTLAHIEQLGAVRQHDALADGTGGLVLSTAQYVAPDRMHLVTAEGDESIAVSGVQAFKRGDEPWRTVRRSAPFKYPAYSTNYDGATAQRLGHDTTLDGRPVRVLTFYVPRDRAWYCWWIDAADGTVRREVMVAPSHYVTTTYDEQNAPAEIALPAGD